MCPFGEADRGPGDRLRDEEEATRREHAAQFRHRAAAVVDDHEEPGGDDPVEASVRLRERAHVVADETGIAHTLSSGVPPGKRDLRRGSVNTGDTDRRMPRGDNWRVISGPAAHLCDVPGTGEIERGDPFDTVVRTGTRAECPRIARRSVRRPRRFAHEMQRAPVATRSPRCLPSQSWTAQQAEDRSASSSPRPFGGESIDD